MFVKTRATPDSKVGITIMIPNSVYKSSIWIYQAFVSARSPIVPGSMGGCCGLPLPTTIGTSDVRAGTTYRIFCFKAVMLETS
ncbi:hypothetical protein EBBID32_46070 [Sphingobium indicum BiD32]|uniref:Uncharacterized protein n=1 Tax=Sphingobium indicum BiD32 TaxID=1301087 RepID=N1MYC6_9SPHN|nr:hypothetical protein [Sphingobium indicum]CCW20233.1 hypothetical protein EBBID32_46070 [Sphingobium indicum BiD32]